MSYVSIIDSNWLSVIGRAQSSDKDYGFIDNWYINNFTYPFLYFDLLLYQNIDYHSDLSSLIILKHTLMVKEHLEVFARVKPYEYDSQM